MESNTVGRIGIDYGLASAGIGYVCIPRNYDRDIYIRNCLANNTVCLRTENFEFLQDVYIDKVAIQNVTFPQNRNENGSPVVWVRIAKHNLPVAIGVLNLKNSGQDVLSENTFCFVRRDEDNNVVSIVGDPAKGLKINNINGDGKLEINVLNKFFQGALNFYVQGDINFNIERDLNISVGREFKIVLSDPSKNNKKTTVSYKFGDGLTINDEFKNQVIINDSGVQIQVPSGKTITLGKGESNEPAVLGNKLEDSFNDVVNCFDILQTSVDAAVAASSSIPALVGFQAMKTALVALTSELQVLKLSFDLFKSKTVEVSP